MKALAIALASIVLSTACSQGSPAIEIVPKEGTPSPVKVVTQQPSPSVSQSTPAADSAIKRYVDGLASQDPDAMLAAARGAAPNSPAQSYLLHQAYVQEAELDGGISVEPDNLTPADNGFSMCAEGEDAKSCTKIGGFVLRGNKVADLTINGRAPGPRLTLGSGTAVNDHGVKVVFLSAYRAITKDMFWVTLRVTSGKQRLDPFGYEAKYRSPNGRQRTASDWYGPDELDPGSTATYALAFPAVVAGGRVTVGGCLSDCDEQWQATLRVG